MYKWHHSNFFNSHSMADASITHTYIRTPSTHGHNIKSVSRMICVGLHNEAVYYGDGVYQKFGLSVFFSKWCGNLRIVPYIRGFNPQKLKFSRSSYTQVSRKKTVGLVSDNRYNLLYVSVISTRISAK